MAGVVEEKQVVGIPSTALVCLASSDIWMATKARAEEAPV
jgi:hypothetical protein